MVSVSPVVCVCACFTAFNLHITVARAVLLKKSPFVLSVASVFAEAGKQNLSYVCQILTKSRGNGRKGGKLQLLQ